MAFRVDLAGDLPRTERTPQGGLRAPAYLTRTGVLVYTTADGATVRELRHPDEVFAAASLATLAGAPLTIGHPGVVTAENWRALAVGHVGDDVAADGRFVSAAVRIQDAAAVAAVESGQLVELSCGYECEIDPTPGVYDGEPYDAIQRSISYNHVGLGPRDWGRAGNDVGLRLDGAYVSGMSNFRQDEANAPIAPAAVQAPQITLADLDKVRAEAEESRGKLAAAEERIKQLESELAHVRDPTVLDSRLAARLSLVDSARKVLGPSAKFDGLTDLQIMAQVVTSVYPDAKTDGKSEDFIRGLFQGAIASGVSSESLAALRKDLRDTVVEGAGAESESEKAYREHVARSQNAWKAKGG